jgi:hypothetical protein
MFGLLAKLMKRAGERGSRTAHVGGRREEAGRRSVRRCDYYCARECCRVSYAYIQSFFSAPVRAGAFLFRELLLSRVIEARAVCGATADHTADSAAPSRSATAGSDFSDDRSSARRSSRRIASLRLGIFGCDRRQSSTNAKIGPSSGNRTTAVCSCMKAPRVQCYEMPWHGEVLAPSARLLRWGDL